MNRRQFLASTAAAMLSTPVLLRGAAAQEGPFRVKYYPVAAGMGSRDVTPAPDGTIWFCGQRNGTLGRLDPRDGSFKLVDLGKGAAPLPRSTSLNEPSRGSSRPSVPLRWPQNQIVPSRAGVTSREPMPAATG